ncbi:flagellin N-terminal helical domain-containing protein [Pannonibacter sp. Q-1]|uniref:Flagellin n=1 Tax=Pannonibacter phragmitetus TaxID=121719 RepID=A0A0L0J189_9HYPH|nr:flagellin [Pannonibacter phragmitetus]ALV28207.1 ABC transporter substrate-binding protein [Pannonibacter phragmitetus]KND19190.1 ABC transporter substrate-binding protein [Pannonibacter phragmitetus]
MADITLSAAVRQNLLTLQQTADFMSGVQNKLATGKKVNSALDNPNSFFTASGLNNRAKDLSTLLDDMGQVVQTMKAADQGITNITKLTETAKAKANQALQTQSQYERAQYAKQYNDLLKQIEDMAKDSSYKGKNLLAGEGNNLTAIFNEDNTSKLTVTAVNYTDTTLSTGLNLQDLTLAKGGAASLQLEGGKASATFLNATGDALSSGSLLQDATGLAVGDVLQLRTASSGGGAGVTGFTNITIGANTTVQNLVDQINGVAGVRAEFDEKTGSLSIISNDDVYLHNTNASAATPAPSDLISVSAANFTSGSQLLKNSGSFNVEDILTLTDGNGYELGSLEVTDKTSVKDLTDFIKRFNGVNASFNTSTGKLTIESDVSLNLKSTNADFAATGFTEDTDGVNVVAAVESGFATDEAINQTIDKLNNALSVLRSQASEFGTNLSTVQIRQDYTKSMINTLQEGAGKLTLADTNEEGANLLALQTRQQLASTSLSFASQADQTVLSLF